MLDGNGLSDHPAHRCTEHVCGLDAQVIEQCHCIECHVRQRVWHRRNGLLHECRRDHLVDVDRHAIQSRGQTTVAVVETHDVEPAIDEHVAEVRLPLHHLRRVTHD